MIERRLADPPPVATVEAVCKALGWVAQRLPQDTEWSVVKARGIGVRYRMAWIEIAEGVRAELVRHGYCWLIGVNVGLYVAEDMTFLAGSQYDDSLFGGPAAGILNCAFDALVVHQLIDIEDKP